MRRRSRLAISAACGGLAMLLSVAHADGVRAEVESERAAVLERYGGEVTSLVVARGRLSAGDVVSVSDVEVREWLADLAPEGALSSLDDAVGLRLSAPVAAGSPLTTVDFSSNGESLQVPEGRVAVTVRLADKAMLSGDVAPGTRLLAYEVTGEGAGLISADVTSLTASDAAARAASSQSMTVALVPADVTRALSAAASGTLRLAIPADDVGRSGDGGAQTPQTPAPTVVAPEEGAEPEGQSGVREDAGTVGAAGAAGAGAGGSEPVTGARTSDAPATAGTRGSSAVEGGA